MLRTTLLLLALAGLAPGATAAIKTETVTYTHAGVTLKGHLVFDDAAAGKRPGVLVVHEWWGLDDYAKKRATMLAELGYVAFCVDMYGDGKTADHPEKAMEMMTAVRKNGDAWKGRAQAGLDILKKHSRVDASKLGAIGYCFGGSTVLQLAMTGADVKAVVSFHGALPKPSVDDAKAIKCKVLVCHGAEDSFIPEEVCGVFRKVMSEAKVDYEMSYYGGAVHSFTVPGADKHGNPMMKYNAAADRRSWAQMRGLFAEVFGQ